MQVVAGLTMAETSHADDLLRAKVAQLLGSDLKATVWPRAETSEDVNAIVGNLARIAPGDVVAKLVMAGVTDYVVQADGMDQPCETCMYYLQHRRFCELPELMLPVEPGWSCRLWRI